MQRYIVNKIGSRYILKLFHTLEYLLPRKYSFSDISAVVYLAIGYIDRNRLGGTWYAAARVARPAAGTERRHRTVSAPPYPPTPPSGRNTLPVVCIRLARSASERFGYLYLA